ncbi:MAG: EamA family transporter RarD [Dermatophilaceae bacterium]
MTEADPSTNTRSPAPGPDTTAQLPGVGRPTIRRLADQQRLGLLFGLGAYLLWGLLPFFFVALAPAGPWEILGHRVVWTFSLCIMLLAFRRDWAWVRPLLRRRRMLMGLTVAAALIAVNWLTYLKAVLDGHTSEGALGYFLNPLVTVALGVLVLHERLRPLQWLAVGIAAVAAGFLTVVAGQVPVTALVLAVSFALYGLIKNRVGADLPALHGLTVETTVLLPLAAAILVWSVASQATFAAEGVGHAAILVLTGPVTAVPLLLFAAAARRVPLVTVGLLQFIAPIMQLLAALALGEHISPARWVGFGIVWVALVVLTVDSLHARLRR